MDDEPDRQSDDEPSTRDQGNGSYDARRSRLLERRAERGGVGPAVLRLFGDGALQHSRETGGDPAPVNVVTLRMESPRAPRHRLVKHHAQRVDVGP